MSVLFWRMKVYLQEYEHEAEFVYGEELSQLLMKVHVEFSCS